jgi:PhzF family phenazine biosynthesis protein
LDTERGTTEVLHYTAFTRDGAGGNPAGVVLDAGGLSDARMLRIAQELGYSETAFVVSGTDSIPDAHVRYFSPLAEVPFCGHATIATAVAIAERHGTGDLHLRTLAGSITVRTRREEGGVAATLTSPPTSTRRADPEVLAEAVAALRLRPEDLDARYPEHVAFAGNHHLVLGLGGRDTLASLDYDYAALSSLMARESWTTVHLFWAETATTFHARNAFPPGGVVEDPATGAAAAAFGGYLRALHLVPVPGRLTIIQGVDMGVPCQLDVEVEEHTDTVRVTGHGARAAGHDLSRW